MFTFRFSELQTHELQTHRAAAVAAAERLQRRHVLAVHALRLRGGGVGGGQVGRQLLEALPARLRLLGGRLQLVALRRRMAKLGIVLTGVLDICISAWAVTTRNAQLAERRFLASSSQQASLRTLTLSLLSAASLCRHEAAQTE